MAEQQLEFALCEIIKTVEHHKNASVYHLAMYAEHPRDDDREDHQSLAMYHAGLAWNLQRIHSLVKNGKWPSMYAIESE